METFCQKTSQPDSRRRAARPQPPFFVEAGREMVPRETAGVESSACGGGGAGAAGEVAVVVEAGLGFEAAVVVDDEEVLGGADLPGAESVTGALADEDRGGGAWGLLGAKLVDAGEPDEPVAGAGVLPVAVPAAPGEESSCWASLAMRSETELEPE